MLGGNTARSEGNMSAMDPEPEKLLPMTRAVRDIIEQVLRARGDWARSSIGVTPASMDPQR